MEFIRKNHRYAPYVRTGLVGLTLIGLAACSQGDSSTTTGTPAPGGSAGLSGPIVFVRNNGDQSLMSFKLKGDSGNDFINRIDPAKFEGVLPGDMQLTDGDWLFVNLTDAGKVAAIDPVRSTTPVHEVNLPEGAGPGATRPVHIFRDANNGQVIWSMNDGVRPAVPPAPPGPTDGDDVVNCAATGGGSVTAIHNSHLGPGAPDPEVLGVTCLLADGHKVAAFSTSPKRVFVSSTTAGEIAVLDDDDAPTNLNYRKMIGRIDLCDSTKEATPCNDESSTLLTVPFTPNSSEPHGIRFSKSTNRIYSYQEGYNEIAEINPASLEVTKKFGLAGTPYTGFGISPDGRFLLLRGNGTAPAGTRLGVIDLGTAGAPRTDFTIPELKDTSAGAFKFSPDGKKFYILAGNAKGTKQDRLFVFDTSTLTAATPALTLIKEIVLVPSGDSDPTTFESAHTLDILAQGPIGAGEAKYIVVTNRLANTISIINASDNEIKQNVPVGPKPGAVLVYESGATERGHQATN